MPLKALIFDVDGTLAETEDLHRMAFNRAFADAGISWYWSRTVYGRLLKVTGGRERILAYAEETATPGIDAAPLHRTKNDHYGKAMAGSALALRDGVERLIRLALARGLSLGIATTTSRSNVDNLFRATLGMDALDRFRSVRTGEDVGAKKPDPEVYRRALDDLGVRACESIAFEDSANGLKAAKALGIPTVVTPGIYTAADDFSGADCILDSLDHLFTTPVVPMPDCPAPLADALGIVRAAAGT